jgi:mRNA interferase RelE/StbE
VNRQVIWQRRALDDLAEITRRDRRAALRISRAVDRFAEAAHGDVRKLQGDEDRYRLRVGDFRVIFRFDGDGVVILVLRVRNRREAYRD